MTLPNHKLLWLIVVCAALIGGGIASGQDDEMPPASVIVSKAAEVERANSEHFIGSITPIRMSTIGSAVAGRVSETFFEAGDLVSMTSETSEFEPGPLGEPMVQLRTVTLDLQIAAAAATLLEKQQTLKELEAAIPLEIQAAESTNLEIKAQLDYVRSNYERMKELEEQGGGLSAREVQESFSLYQSQQNQLASSAANLQRLNATKESRLAQARAAQDNQEALLQQLREQKENFTIRAPFEGFVVEKLAYPGEWIGIGDPIAEIVQLDPIELIVNIPQQFVLELQTLLDSAKSSGGKLSAQVTVEGIQQWIDGEVLQIVPQADLRSRAFPVRIRMNNPQTESGHLLKPGMLAKVTFFVGARKRITMVSKDALVLGNPIMVYVADPGPAEGVFSARPVPVTVGAASGEWIQVDGGVAPGERVVVRGNERLMPGQALIVVEELDHAPPAEPEAAAPVAQK